MAVGLILNWHYLSIETFRGFPAPKTGQLKVGYEAGILGLTANPGEDVKILKNKKYIKWV